ncbi:MAG: hypothetical protein KAI64_06065, partial [Thermoplasmata archaeon]|nr:hypothetical protein [Thermoplasmata archaeon]
MRRIFQVAIVGGVILPLMSMVIHAAEGREPLVKPGEIKGDLAVAVVNGKNITLEDFINSAEFQNDGKRIIRGMALRQALKDFLKEKKVVVTDEETEKKLDEMKEQFSRRRQGSIEEYFAARGMLWEDVV